jgi:multiple sugar transport system permease protein
MRAALHKRLLSHARGIAFLLPSAFFIFGLIYYPVINAVVISFFKYEVLSRRMSFVGLKNYLYIFHEPLFAVIFQRTIVWTVAVVAGTTLLAMAVAQLLDARFRMKKAVRGIFILPWATSIALSAMLYRWALNSERGLLNYTLRDLLHAIPANVGWLASGSTAFPWLIYVGIWVSVPFTALVILAAVQSVPRETYEASNLDGANAVQRYFFVTLPFIAPILLVTILINFIAVFNSFPIIWVMTEGGPVNETDIMVTILYKEAFKFLDFGRASAVAVLIFLFLLALSIMYLVLVSRREEV